MSEIETRLEKAKKLFEEALKEVERVIKESKEWSEKMKGEEQ